MERDVLVAVLFQRRRRNHHRRRVRQYVDEGRERFLQRDLDRIVVEHIGAGHAIEQDIALQLVVRIGHAVHRGLYRIGLEIGVVVEFHALAQPYRIFQAVLADQVAVGQHIDQFHILVEAEQALIKGFGDGHRHRVVGVVRIHGGERRFDRERDGLERPGLGGGELESGACGADGQPAKEGCAAGSGFARHGVAPD